MKKSLQLGMNASTASNRLIKDLLFKLVTDSGQCCYRCGKPLIRDNFSVEHKTPWLNSEDPAKHFFDLENITYSHLTCNSSAGGKGRPRIYSKEDAEKRIKESKKNHWTPEKRREHYIKTGN